MKNPIVLSMGVKSMYPDLNIEKVAASEFLESDLRIEVDEEELGLYRAVMYQGKREELVSLRLDKVVP